MFFEDEIKSKLDNLQLNPHAIFDQINHTNRDFIYEDDFAEFLKEHGFYVKKEDVKFLLKQFDCNRDGRVSFHEFTKYFN